MNNTFEPQSPYLENPIFSVAPAVDDEFAVQAVPSDPRSVKATSIYPIPFDPTPYVFPRSFHVMFTPTLQNSDFTLHPTTHHIPPSRRRKSHTTIPHTYWFSRDEMDRMLHQDGPLVTHLRMSMRLVERYREVGIIGDRVVNGVTSPGALYTEAFQLNRDGVSVCRDALSGTFASLEEAMEAGGIVQRTADLMTGIVRVLRRVALDLCAVIGGVHLPAWPPSVTTRGALIPIHRLDRSSSKPEHAVVAALERWGIPLYIVHQSQAATRLEYNDPTLPPVKSMPDEEAAHQARLRRVLRGRPGDKGKSVPYVANYQGCYRGSEPLKCPEKDLDHLLFHVLDPRRPDPLPFDEFSRHVQALVGFKMWPGRLWEEGRHGQSKGRTWYQRRPHPLSVGHGASYYCVHFVPPHYFDPTLLFPHPNGQYPAHTLTRAIVPVPAAQWFGIEVTYFWETDNFNVMVERAYPHVYARMFARTHDSQALGGFDGQRKPFKLEFWLKEEEKRKALLPELSQAYPGKTVKMIESTKDGAWRYWQGYQDLQYVSYVYEHAPTVLLRRALLTDWRLPPLEAIPDDEDYRAEVAKLRHGRRHALLGYDKATFTIPGAVQLPSSRPSISPRTGEYSFSLEYLHNITRVSRPSSLTLGDFVYLHRMEAILNLLADMDFTVPLFRAPDGVFGRILWYITRCIIRDQRQTDQCKLVKPDLVGVVESVRWSKRERRVVLRLADEYSAPPPPSKEEWEAWKQKEDIALLEELKKGKHQKRKGKGRPAH